MEESTVCRRCPYTHTIAMGLTLVKNRQRVRPTYDAEVGDRVVLGPAAPTTNDSLDDEKNGPPVSEQFRSTCPGTASTLLQIARLGLLG